MAIDLNFKLLLIYMCLSQKGTCLFKVYIAVVCALLAFLFPLKKKYRFKNSMIPRYIENPPIFPTTTIR
jgi:hypothetical protein